MSADFLTRNRLVLAKVETTAGTDASPVPATDAVLFEQPKGNPNMELEQTSEATGSLSNSQSIVGGGYRAGTGSIYIKGSGTPGTAPEFTPYLQAGALGLTTLAADSANTARAGTSTTIQLASGAPSTDLTGMVIETTGGTGPDQTRVITAYDTTSKTATVTPDWTVTPDNTTTYAVRACNLFVPVSTGLKTISHYLYKKNAGSGNAVLEKTLGAAANLSFAMQTRQSMKMSVTLRGQLSDPVDTANPTGAVFNATRPRPFVNADAFLGGSRVCFRNFTMDLGNQIVQADCPGATFGFDPARVTDRRVTGRLNPLVVTLSQMAPFTDLKNGVVQPLWLRYGETAGNKVSLLIPKLSYSGLEDDDLDGNSANGLPFQANGFDSEFFLCFY